MSKTDSIVNAQKLPYGARFFRCALQVNPFDYIVRHSKETVFNNESDYNAAIVEACQRIGIEVIAITDHQRCSTGQSLAEAARAEGIVVFIGAELETKEGVHTKDAPQNLRPILLDKNSDYLRDRPVAVINAQDVSSPDDLEKPGSSCLIKMSDVMIEGLRQAFLDPVSRIRLASDPPPEEHTEFIAMSWQGGFLDGAAIHLNENLNVLIGGRGTGKSTIIESIRYVLGMEPLGEEALKAHSGIVRQVLRSGTKISMLVLITAIKQTEKGEYFQR